MITWPCCSIPCVLPAVHWCCKHPVTLFPSSPHGSAVSDRVGFTEPSPAGTVIHWTSWAFATLNLFSSPRHHLMSASLCSDSSGTSWMSCVSHTTAACHYEALYTVLAAHWVEFSSAALHNTQDFINEAVTCCYYYVQALEIELARKGTTRA